jgi:L-ascorbate metabolism protein UlaG (beta-lactamase superfamily)
MIWFISTAAVLILALFVAEVQLAAPKYEQNTSDHFDGRIFKNPDEVGTHRYWEVLKWWFSGNDKGAWDEIKEKPVASYSIPETHENPWEVRVTFVNHATYLLQVDGLNILTDPIWSYRASPYQWIGPKRMRAPGIAFEDLPPIDLVLISHNHYDHLDIPTLKRLQDEHQPNFIVPLGVEKCLHEHNICNIAHLDWWDRHSVSDKLSLSAVPARHFSGRGLFDRNKTLWCGYVLHSSIGNIYLAGDTGYGNFVNEIYDTFGPMEVSIIPIGAYKPRWFMHAIHVSPDEAVQIHKDVRSQISFPMHFGTFPLADDGMYEPIECLKVALQKQNVPLNDFPVLQEGETHIVETSQVSEKAV